MLEYYPERRATAQKMLDHPWLNMDFNFEFKMNEREYEKMIMIKNSKKHEKREYIPDKDVVNSDIEVNMGDDEDNFDIEANEEEDSYVVPNDLNISIQNFNNSFAIYGQHVKLSALDKANPQFK